VRYLKSGAVAQQLGIPYYTLFELMRGGHLQPPQKDSSGQYVWTEADVERARHAVAERKTRQEKRHAATA
jgi:DNA-binding transcriptional MerR regulator